MLQHCGDLRSGAQKCSRQVHRKHLRPLSRFNVGQRLRNSNHACIVKSDVQTAECCPCGSDGLLVCAILRYIPSYGKRSASLIFDFLDRQVQRALSSCHEHDARAVRGEQCCGRLSDARTCACDDGDFTV
jgi:hypothetical protein